MSAPALAIPEIEPTPDVAQLTPEEKYEQLQAKYGQRLEKLPTQLVNALRGLVREFNEQDQFARRREGMRDRKNRFYERGVQHLYETKNGFCSMLPGMTYTTGSGAKLQAPRYIDDYAIFLAAGLHSTAAQLAPEEKNKISHRAQALLALVAELREKGLAHY